MVGIYNYFSVLKIEIYFCSFIKALKFGRKRFICFPWKFKPTLSFSPITTIFPNDFYKFLKIKICKYVSSLVEQLHQPLILLAFRLQPYSFSKVSSMISTRCIILGTHISSYFPVIISINFQRSYERFTLPFTPQKFPSLSLISRYFGAHIMFIFDETWFALGVVSRICPIFIFHLIFNNFRIFIFYFFQALLRTTLRVGTKCITTI